MYAFESRRRWLLRTVAVASMASACRTAMHAFQSRSRCLRPVAMTAAVASKASACLASSKAALMRWPRANNGRMMAQSERTFDTLVRRASGSAAFSTRVGWACAAALVWQGALPAKLSSSDASLSSNMTWCLARLYLACLLLWYAMGEFFSAVGSLPMADGALSERPNGVVIVCWMLAARSTLSQRCSQQILHSACGTGCKASVSVFHLQ